MTKYARPIIATISKIRKEEIMLVNGAELFKNVLRGVVILN